MAGRRPVVRTQTQRRRMQWAREAGSAALTAAGAPAAIDVLNDFNGAVGAESQYDSTVRRILLDIHVEATGAATPAGVARVDYGLIVGESDVAPTLAPWSSQLAMHRDWMLIGSAAPTGTVASIIAGARWRETLDIHSGRKLHGVSDTVWLVLAAQGVNVQLVTYSQLLLALA